MQSRHSLLTRLSWHPLVVAIPLGIMIYRSSMYGLSARRIVSLAIIGLWFGLAILDWARPHRLLDWLDRGGGSADSEQQ